MREVTIEGRTFVVNRLDPRHAFHVVRRIAPLVGSLADVIPYAIGQQKFDPNDLEVLTKLAEPIAKGISDMPEADADYVIDTCLSVVQVRIEQGMLTPIMAGNHLMYDWITMPMMIRLVIETIAENLSGFTLAGAPAS